jgi:hypothetical protein
VSSAWALAVVTPFWLGLGAVRLLYGKRDAKLPEIADACLTGFLVCIGLAFGAQLTALLGSRSFSDCVAVFLASLAVMAAASSAVLWKGRKLSKEAASSVGARGRGLFAPGARLSRAPWTRLLPLSLAAAFLWLLLLSQASAPAARVLSRSGDMTLETVQTFLATDRIWERNPLTGREYVSGVPLRLKILALPALYAGLCRLTGFTPEEIVCRYVPALVVFGACLVYYRLAAVLFGGNAVRRRIFMILAASALLLGTNREVMDGFGLLYGAYRGTAIRNVILLPYTVCLCLEKKWKSVPLCVLAEACIVWTFYGLGVCLLAAVLLAAAGAWKQKGCSAPGGA